MAKVLVHKRGKATLSGSHVCVSVMGDGVQLWAKTVDITSLLMFIRFVSFTQYMRVIIRL
jgi:hypothetical protein